MVSFIGRVLCREVISMVYGILYWESPLVEVPLYF